MRWILFDTTYLCHLARYTLPRLQRGDGDVTSIAFGVLRMVDRQVHMHGADNVVFAFDFGGPGFRSEIDPMYKSNRRKELTAQEEDEQREFFDQVTRLRMRVLPAIGYRNIFCVKGYEGDDILAKVAIELDLKDSAVMVTGDTDLWQCLQSNVVWHNPSQRRTVTIESFQREWGVDPGMWASVKAIAGCSSDGVQGVRGVGEKSAARWFSGSLKEDSAKGKLICNNLDVMAKNLPLVRLPFPGLKLPDLRDDRVDEGKRMLVEMELGIRPKRKPARRGFVL